MKNEKKKITLSKRLEAVAGLIERDGTLADVGTDHGYIPIAMVLRGHAEKAIAMDLRTGPLERAREHITAYGLEDRIETRLSDGVSALAENEADSIVVAGMGGELVIHILETGKAVCKSAKELILQPQSEIDEVRKYLRENGYRIVDEDMVEEEQKYYPMMRVIPQEDAERIGYMQPEEKHEAKETLNHMHLQDAERIGYMQPEEKNGQNPEAKIAVKNEAKNEAKETLNHMHLQDLYGPILLAEKNPVLLEFLQKQERHYEEILDGLNRQPDSEKICVRRDEMKEKLEYNRMAQHRMKNAAV